MFPKVDGGVDIIKERPLIRVEILTKAYPMLDDIMLVAVTVDFAASCVTNCDILTVISFTQRLRGVAEAIVKLDGCRAPRQLKFVAAWAARQWA
ncbi:hypothetical protein CIB48_g7345 [Xylaria polymorpha]|nr:hypothetical protein CIB48_g7345 [Xylaria polymorpha]